LRVEQIVPVIQRRVLAQQRLHLGQVVAQAIGAIGPGYAIQIARSAPAILAISAGSRLRRLGSLLLSSFWKAPA
jgi:hypothetical protein